MTGEIPEERRNSVFIPIYSYKESDKLKVQNCGGISFLNACYKICSKVLNTKLKARAEQFLFGMREWIRKSRSSIDPLFSIKLLVEKRIFQFRN
jgi:hypothetical protein